jgi:hypothetical protein
LSFAERLIDGAVRGTPLAHAGTPNRAVRGDCAIAMAAGNVTVTPDEEVLARGALRLQGGRQTPGVAARVGAAGRGDQLGSKHHGALARLGGLGTRLEGCTGIADRTADADRSVSSGTEPALELCEELEARRG